MVWREAASVFLFALKMAGNPLSLPESILPAACITA